MAGGNNFNSLLEYVFRNFEISEFNKCAGKALNHQLTKEICFETGNAVFSALDHRVRSILEIAGGYGNFTGNLSLLCDKLITVEKDEEKLRLNEIRNRCSDNIDYCRDVPSQGMFDLIFINAADERISDYNYSDIVKLYKELFPLLSDDGKIFLLLSRKGGNYSSAVKYNIEQEKEALKSTGAKNVFIRYPYPGIRTNMLYSFSEFRQPTASELFFDEITCKSGDAEELLKNNSFCDVAALEIFKSNQDCICEYSKMSVMRREPFRAVTEIIRNENGVRAISKSSAVSDTSHIDKLNTSYQQLSKLFDGTVFNVNRIIESRPGNVKFEYVEGETLFDVLSARVLERDEAGVTELICRYAQILCSKAVKKFNYSQQFYEVFGNSLKYNNYYSMTYTDVDFCFDNIIINNGKWTIIDYEFCFDFPIPVEFLVFRSILYLFLKMDNWQQYIPMRNRIYIRLGMLDRYGEFMAMEKSLQKYITGDTCYQRTILANERIKQNSCSAAEKELENLYSTLVENTE